VVAEMVSGTALAPMPAATLLSCSNSRPVAPAHMPLHSASICAISLSSMNFTCATSYCCRELNAQLCGLGNEGLKLCVHTCLLQAACSW
jgi:hypothetical protein